MDRPISVNEAADRLGVSARWVRRLCEQHDIGVMVTSRMRVLSESDLARLQEVRRPPGRPPTRPRLTDKEPD